MKFFLTFLMMTLICFAQELSSQQIKIRMMIKEIKEAPENQRFAKMNAFKKQLREMNAQARQEAIISLQASLQAQIRNSEKFTTNSDIHRQESQKQLQIQHQVQSQQQIQKSISGHLGRSQK